MAKITFIPREQNFYELFDEIAAALVEAAERLLDLCSDYRDVPDKARVLREMEKRIDDATDGIRHRLNISFVTPIEREDIHALASAMDDVLDYIEASADRMLLYDVKSPREEAIELAQSIVDATKQLKIAMDALPDFRNNVGILKACVEINRIEDQADKVYRSALSRLFKEDTKPLEIAKWQEIFHRLEMATDRCEDVANVLEGILVKNA